MFTSTVLAKAVLADDDKIGEGLGDVVIEFFNSETKRSGEILLVGKHYVHQQSESPVHLNRG